MRVILKPIDGPEAEEVIQKIRKEYVKDLMRVGWSEKESWGAADTEFTLDTALVMRILSPLEEVGIVSTGIYSSHGELFVNWLEIYEPHRLKGYACGTIEVLEKVAKKGLLPAVRLHVFEHNEPARRLYEKCGFVTTGRIMMRKV